MGKGDGTIMNIGGLEGDAVMDLCNAALDDGKARDAGVYSLVPEQLLQKAREDGWQGKPMGEVVRPDGRKVFIFRRVPVN